MRLGAPMHHALLLAAFAVAGCAGSSLVVPAAGGVSAAGGGALKRHAIVGFSVDTPKRAAIAAREGIDATILYGGSPDRGSPLETALDTHGIAVIDGGISGILFYWECHRTHTVKPPPSSYGGDDTYCHTDENPRIHSETIVLREVAKILERDAHRRYVVGHWVLDDWPWWDAGSARELLQKIHAAIAAKAPGRPAICGFGAGVAAAGKVDWDPGTAANYSNGGCDIVGWYNYSPFGRRHPSKGEHLDWTMKALLPAMRRSLARRGWRIAQTPLYGIGQAWGGSYEKRYYQPGLTRQEMLDQAKAFCAFGASYIGWYAWDDSGFERRTRTPEHSHAIARGIAAGIDACERIWTGGTASGQDEVGKGTATSPTEEGSVR